MTIPVSRPPSTTTSRRIPWRTISSAASSTSIAGSAVITGEEAWSADVVAEVAPVGDHRQREVAVGDEPDRRVSSSTSTTEPTLRSRISSAISRTVRSGAAVTTSPRS